MEKGEQELIRKLKQGDEKAFNSLFYHYHARVYNLAKKFLQYKEEAEEIVQIVFIALWENRQQIDENQSLGGYILTIARHWIYNTLKKNVYRQGYIDYITGQNDSFNLKTEDIVFYNELNALLNKLISDLPPKRSEIFKLSRIDGLSYREIADQLSITESTVNTQITKSLDFIRKNIKILY